MDVQDLFDDAGGDEVIDLGGVQASFGENFAAVLAQAGRFEDGLFLGATEVRVARGREVGGAILEVVRGEEAGLLHGGIYSQLEWRTHRRRGNAGGGQALEYLGQGQVAERLGK